MTFTPCRIRSDQFESRCRTCGAHWDRDDEAPPCPRQNRAYPESLARSDKYVSALPRDYFGR